MSNLRSSGTSGVRQAGSMRADLLGNYLNDHLAGASASTDRAQYMVRTLGGTSVADTLEPVATEIAQYRGRLLYIMRRLGMRVQRYKLYACHLAKRAGV